MSRGVRPSRRLRAIGKLIQAQSDRAKRRKPPEAGLAVPAVPPRGPLPLEGGAEAPLD
jgi:hypothetical protein